MLQVIKSFFALTSAIYEMRSSTQPHFLEVLKRNGWITGRFWESSTTMRQECTSLAASYLDILIIIVADVTLRSREQINLETFGCRDFRHAMNKQTMISRMDSSLKIAEYDLRRTAVAFVPPSSKGARQAVLNGYDEFREDIFTAA